MSTRERYQEAIKYARLVGDPDDRRSCMAMCASWDTGYGSWPRAESRTENMREIARIFYPNGER